MFWRHKDSVDKPFVLIGGLALLAVAVLAVALILILSSINKKNNDVTSSTAISGAEEVVDTKAEEAQVVSKYNEGLNVLKTEVAGSTDFSNTLKQVFNEFFFMHVPKNRLEKHFQTMLKIKRISESEIKDVSVAKKDITDALSDLLIR